VVVLQIIELIVTFALILLASLSLSSVDSSSQLNYNTQENFQQSVIILGGIIIGVVAVTILLAKRTGGYCPMECRRF
jgi:hypothetical protein